MKKILMSVSVSVAIMVAFASNLSAQKKFELLWADEFNYTGLPDSSIWSYDVGGHGWGNDELQFYTKNRSENAQVKDGKLFISAIREKYKGNDYTSARLVTANKADLLYGRMEVRAKLPTGRGTWPAIWMLSTDWAYGAWPESGEIDIMELVGWDPDVVHFSAHCLDYFFKINTQKTSIIKVNRSDSAFYTYAVEWTPDSIRGYVDDSLYFSFGNERKGWTKWPFDKPFHLILNIAVGGGWGSVRGIDTTIWPQKMEVDYVRAYKLITAPDKIAPSAPINIEGIANSSNILLSWDPAYDNYSVKEYEILVNGKVAGTTKKHSFSLKDLKASTSYKIDIFARDWAGNESKPLSKAINTTETNVYNIPGKVEAENYISESGTYIEKTADTLGGYNVNWIEPGDWMSYKINVKSKENLKLIIRAATERKDAVLDLFTEDQKLITSIPISNTASWQKWRNFTSSDFKLKQGQQKIILKVRGDRMNLNWFEIE